MAAAPSAPTGKSNTVSDEERRWVVIGICLHKILTPALRNVLANEIPNWYQTLVYPPYQINKQTFAKHLKNIPPSSMKLNYESINNNAIPRKTPRSYDYNVKDPLSLAKLFMKPFMANFTGFDQTMDTSAVLSIMCESSPFITSAAASIASKVRSDIRNEWAHCNFSHWTELHFQNAIQTIELLVAKANMTPVEVTVVVAALNYWKSKGIELCFGYSINPELLKLVKSEVSQLMESVLISEKESEAQRVILENLAGINDNLKQEIESLTKRYERTEQMVSGLETEEKLHYKELLRTQSSNAHKIELVQTQLSKLNLGSDEEISSIFCAPQANRWFSGREGEIQKLKYLLENQENGIDLEISLVAVCGLGGTGKTSLVVEYAKRMKDHYKGGVFWFSAEDDSKLENSVNDVALFLGTFQYGSFDTSFSKTFARISRIRKPWLIVLDNMDQFTLSQKTMKFVAGSWQQGVSGHFVITSRRKPQSLASDIRGFEVSCSIALECFDLEEAKKFLFYRTEIPCNEETSVAADKLVHELGGLPLALEQAGAYIKYLGCSLSSYLESYTSQHLALLHRQHAAPVSEYDSPERRAVYTTWCLNFEHIRKNVDGEIAVRFLNACAFLSPDEIQRELINVGKPLVEDERFRQCIGTSLGSHQVLKMMTDFSLFRELQTGPLWVHHLVQEVIRDSLSLDQKVESFIDAVRLLNYALSNCPCPRELLSNLTNEQQHIATLNPPNPSLFYQWSKLCLHCHELRKHLHSFLSLEPSKALNQTVFCIETVRIIYECALHLSVNDGHDEAVQTVSLAHRILDWAALRECDVSRENFQVMFPHFLPLPHSLGKLIKYSCRAPHDPGNPSSSGNEPGVACSVSKTTDEEVEKLRLEGNQLFKVSNYVEAIDIYSRAIDMSKGSSFDATLLSNRASAYLKVKQYDCALKDATDYIKQCPECWKGYGRKGLALHGLNKKVDAECAAALAFYREKNVFCRYKPFQEVFCDLKQRISICKQSSQLLDALPFVPARYMLDFIPNKADKIILLEPGEYDLSLNEGEKKNVIRYEEDGQIVYHLHISGCVLLGCIGTSPDSKVILNFTGNCGAQLLKSCVMANIEFKLDQGWLNARPNSDLKLSNCSFTSNCKNPTFSSLGQLVAKFCRFVNCCGDGCLIIGHAEMRNCDFSDNGNTGVMVRQGGDLLVENSVFSGNFHGIVTAAQAKSRIINCKIGESQENGILVQDCGSTDVSICGNRILHNHYNGIFLRSCSDVSICANRIFNNHIFNNHHNGILLTSSYAVVERNEIFENGWWGVATSLESWCQVSTNRIYGNKMGGVSVGLRVPKLDFQESIVECNEIFENVGPGIAPGTSMAPVIETNCWHTINNGCEAKCKNNKLYKNKESEQSSNNTSLAKLCSNCRKAGASKKCTRCFSAEYCGKNCQKEHWKRHKMLCPLLLDQSSILSNPDPRNIRMKEDKRVDRDHFTIRTHNPTLAPVGPNYSKPPVRDGKRFIIKVETTEFKYGPDDISVYVYDRSQNIHGYFECHPLYHFVRQCGFVCKSQYVEKKLFLWALLVKGGYIRIFTNEQPPYQPW